MYIIRISKILALFLLIGILACSQKNKQTDAKRPPEKFSVLQLKPISIVTHIDFPATIQGQQVVEIRPKIDGYIEQIFVDEGAPVKKGQLLFRISNPQFEQQVRTAEASIKIAEADVMAAEMNVNKVIPLVEKDIVSKFELQSAQYNLQSKEAQLAQAKAALANAKTNFEYTYIRSPLDGSIGTIPYKVGALVSSNITEPLTFVSDVSKAHVYFSMNEKQLLDFTHNSPGQTIQEILSQRMKPELLLADGSEYPHKGELETASGLISTGTGSVGLKAIFPNPKGFLVNGASSIIRLPEKIDSAYLVPQSASFEQLDKRFIYKVVNNNIVVSVPIASTPTDDGQYFIVRQPLKAGDRVILSGITKLRDSMQIVPVVANPDSVYQPLVTNLP